MRVSLNETSQSEWQSKNLEYLRFEYDLKSDDIVIDLGAYRGEWAEQIFAQYSCSVIVIDPGSWIVGFPHGEVINKAASTHNGTIKCGGAYYYSSIYEDHNTEYECFDLNALLQKYDEIALIKINIEGAEYDLLDHMIEAGLHKRIKDMQVQFHLIEGMDTDARYWAIAGLLSETHTLTWNYPFCWENWRRIE